MHSFRLYWRYIGVSIRSQMQYRTSFIFQTLGQCGATAIEFLAVWALFDRFGALQGWTLPEAALFYGMISVTFAVADALSRGFDLFGRMVQAGDFDRLLLRPRSTVLQLIGQELRLSRAGRLAQGTIVLGWSLSRLDLVRPLWSAGLLAVTVAGGVCLFTGLLVLQATSAFWTTESLEVWNAFTYGGTFMSQYPITIYRPWFRRLFTFLIPLACVNYYPIAVVLGRETGLFALAPLSGVAFLIGALQIWKIGVRRYRSTGS